MTLGIRYINVNIGPDGTLAFSYNFYGSYGVTQCAPSWTQGFSYLYARYKNVTKYVAGGLVQDCFSTDTWDQDRSVILPDSQGRIRVIYQYRGTSSTDALLSNWFDGVNLGTTDTIESSVPDGPEFSASSDSSQNINVVYKMSDGTMSHAYHSSVSSSWVHYRDIFSGAGASPQ